MERFLQLYVITAYQDSARGKSKDFTVPMGSLSQCSSNVYTLYMMGFVLVITIPQRMRSTQE